MCIAQKDYEYVGFIKLNDSSLISLKVKLQEANGNITGYTLTDVGGEHETKTSVVGNYSEKNKVLQFQEVETIYTKSNITEDDFCYINFTSNSYKLGRSSKLRGKFKGLFPDNTECINGEILLSTKEKQTKKIAKATKFINKTKRIPDSVKQNIDLVKIMDSIQMNMLRNKQVLSVFSKSKDITLVVFDGGREDGDNISISVDGKTVLNNYKLTAEEKSLPIVLNSKITSIVLTANNVGTMSTNTAVVLLYVDGQKIRALTNLKAKETTQINIYLK